MKLLNGQFDVLLAVALAVLATFAHWGRGELGAAVIDLLACLCAALATRWPRAGGLALGAVLLTLLFAPSGWSSLGEYAALIPILGTGMRGQRRARNWMTIGYAMILAALTYADLRGSLMVIFAVSVWASLIAVLWGIGNLFTAYRAGQESAHVAALQHQRLGLARDLHDTVARDLTRASLQVQLVLRASPLPELRSALMEIQRASAQLRWMLVLLRDPLPNSASDTLRGTTSQALAEAAGSLERHGFMVATTIEGELDAIPPAVTPTLRAVIGEACANIERHGDPEQPCVIIVVIGDAVDAAFINDVRLDAQNNEGAGVGLIGLRERLALVGGDLATEQKGSQWISRVTVPL